MCEKWFIFSFHNSYLFCNNKVHDKSVVRGYLFHLVCQTEVLFRSTYYPEQHNEGVQNFQIANYNSYLHTSTTKYLRLNAVTTLYGNVLSNSGLEQAH